MTNLLNHLITREDISVLAHSEGLSFDDEDRISILETMRSIDVQACPGSGKTTLIAAKLILLAKKWPLSSQGICVLSHTNVAKDEIIRSLKRSKTLEARRLLSYPHFIGTIQEYAGKYLAFPCLRSNKIGINHVDTDLCVDLIYSKISHRARSYIDSKNTHSNVLYSFDIGYNNGEFLINVPTFRGASNSDSYKSLHKVRLQLIEEGYFFYRDIFTFAQIALSENPIVPEALRKRFPLVFIDEMQDTQRFQDELLRDIFPLDDPKVIIQRFGDPDQAIFHGIGNDEPNDSFNGKSVEDMDYVVHKSHRFDAELADKIKRLSLNGIPLETELIEEGLADRSLVHSSGESFVHCVIVFNDGTRDGVVQSFANIVSEQFNEEYKKSDHFVVKAIGAVGNEIDPDKEQLKIRHYWSDYDKRKAKNSFKENSLIEAVRYCRQSSSYNWADGYKLLLNSILNLLRLSKKNDDNERGYTGTSLRNLLESGNNWRCFREILYLLLNDAQPLSQEYWAAVCQDLTLLFSLQSAPENAKQYLAYSEETLPVEDQSEGLGKKGKDSVIPLPENMVRHPDGFNVHLSTIHGVKGETHDATLVMETKNYCFDLEVMLPYLVEDLPNDQHPNEQMPDKPHHSRKFKPNKLFMRQLYVAASRSRHLLCFAIHEDRISQPQREALSNLGWFFSDLGNGDVGG